MGGATAFAQVHRGLAHHVEREPLAATAAATPFSIAV